MRIAFLLAATMLFSFVFTDALLENELLVKLSEVTEYLKALSTNDIRG